ncbi:hypothetical protein W97_00300 [Coniosporium apollinis CBS 100218]|uniref:Uncharacterized protein n=1 Tax=Coniosporium apollinis (strain CBS 100218) TaxID=1168221 RepID=R7YH32_CONA1|nr:uncharacterized protein W97_00300 [Coniosporium apollinis CBS 100218]EON61089.1 hypothetical protein W97_00300 [Coniosporium apollinis CBS 100218]
MSRFADLAVTPPDAAFALVEAYAVDTCCEKVDLCPGFYRDEQAMPWILPSVAEQLLYEDPTINHEHLLLVGHPGLVSGAQKLVFGVEASDIARIASI